MNSINSRQSPDAYEITVPDSVNRSGHLIGDASMVARLGVAVVDASGLIVSANAAFATLLGFDKPTAGASLCEHVALKFRQPIARLRARFSSAESSVLTLRGDLQGSPIRIIVDATDSQQRMVIVESIVESDEEKLFNLQHTHLDSLTQLGNRHLLKETIDNWQPSMQEENSIALILMGLDRFKQVNDNLGHEAGDSLLRLVAARVNRSARTSDTIVRLGGDEFIILHTLGSQPAAAEKVAKRLVELMSRPFLVDGQQINVGASVGIAVFNQGSEQLNDLLKHAELALYDAKSAGRGTYRFFEPELERRALERHEIEIQLRRAVVKGEFELLYQPQVVLPDGKITGFEALIRWNNAERGLIPPNDFIYLAEEIGEITAIGKWVLRTACLEAASWPEHLSVAVNVSPVQFQSKHFVEDVHSALQLSGLAPERLEVEITESVLIGDIDQAVAQLQAIQSIGVQIAMDDFGTGYSSLSYLNSFPFSKIKIDQSFVRGEQTDKTRALVDAIVTLGASLGMKTLAEGVETESQFEQLAEVGCKEAQGYLIAKPMKAKDISHFVKIYSEKPLYCAEHHE